MVLQKAKEYRMKADMQSKAALLQRSFFALIENISIQKIRKSYEFKADNHYEITSKRNIFKIFKLLF